LRNFLRITNVDDNSGNYLVTCYHLNSSFFNCYLLEFTNSLNQWEKQELIIKLRKDGKTYREIAHIAGVSLRDIKPTLRKYERKLQTKKGEENNQKIKKISKKRCRAYDLFRNRKNPVEVAIDLELDYEQVFYQRFTNN
jgi:IS30 family transposase